MTQPPPPADGKSNPPDLNYTQEVRFAVVMYGGSSLAIYMNGVAQELLRLVRATAPARDGAVGVGKVAHFTDDALGGSERVYRKLGRMLVRGDAEGDGGPAARERREREGGALRTRFVVDVLTGTSAGGINAVYLAKALANDQSLDDLMGLWKSKGDIGVLLNVEESSRFKTRGREIDLRFEGQPASTLNSPRMYWELLDALRQMDRQGGAGGGAPEEKAERAGEKAGGPLYAEEIDLYVTATDTRGRVVNMRLADKVVQELRHRNVFHFRYRDDDGDGRVNDFAARYNPFLAFAARCTSAHQAAFEVMNLESADLIIEKAGARDDEELRHPHPDLQKFYEDYLLASGNIRLWQKDAGGKVVTKDGKPVALTPGEVKELAAAGELRDRLAEDFYGRFFNDGGTLDNSPFSFVSEVLPFRQTLHPVDRKLLYVEPSPEHPEEADPGNQRWNFVKNAFAGLSTLPSHQTIVEDLDRIRARNRLVERVNNILANLREDIYARNMSHAVYRGNWPRVRSLGQMRLTKLSELIHEKGVSWGGYQRLRIGQVTNDLTLLIARAAGLDEESDEFQAVRYLVKYWRENRYDDHPQPDSPPKAAEIGFLIDYDLSWTIRRLQFLLRTIDELDCLDKSARRIVDITAQRDVSAVWPRNEQEMDAFREELRRARDQINRVYTGLRRARREFWARRDATARGDRGGPPAYLNPFREEVSALNVPVPLLLELLRLPSEERRRERIQQHLAEGENGEAFRRLSEKVRRLFKERLDESRRECGSLLRYPRRGGALDTRQSVRYVLAFYYRFFEDFDQVTFPIFYSTDVGEETDPIEVFRVSPEDASLLVDEKGVNAERGAEGGRIDKLAGTSLGHFGAFFDERWRVNDILWGRLDGAERIISALLPGEHNGAQRERLVREAHDGIIRESWEQELSKLDAGLRRQVEDALLSRPNESALHEIRGGLKDLGVGVLWREFFESRVREGGKLPLWEHFRSAFLKSYEEERHYPRPRRNAMIGKGAGVLERLLRANLEEHRRGLSLKHRALIRVGLVAGGGYAVANGLGKLAVMGVRYAFQKLNDRVNKGAESESPPARG